MTAINYVVRWHLGETNQRDAVITLPIRLRTPSNGPQANWRAAAAVRKKQRQLASWACGGPLAEYRDGLAKGHVAAVEVTVTRIAPRALDGHDNLGASAKSVVDGIADALGLKSDRDPRLTWNYRQERGKPKEYAVEITVMGRADSCAPDLKR